VRPLDVAQQREADRVRAEAAPWVRTTWGRSLVGLLLVGGLLGAVPVGAAFAGAPWWPVVLPAAVLAVVGASAGAVVCARMRAERLIEFFIRSQLPSQEAMDRGLSAFQIDGGRVPPPGEEPASPYWRT
jgi:hypothetical protein